MSGSFQTVIEEATGTEIPDPLSWAEEGIKKEARRGKRSKRGRIPY